MACMECVSFDLDEEVAGVSGCILFVPDPVIAFHDESGRISP